LRLRAISPAPTTTRICRAHVVPGRVSHALAHGARCKSQRASLGQRVAADGVRALRAVDRVPPCYAGHRPRARSVLIQANAKGFSMTRNVPAALLGRMERSACAERRATPRRVDPKKR